MADHAAPRETWEVGIGDHHRAVDHVGEGSDAGAQDEPDLGAEAARLFRDAFEELFYHRFVVACGFVEFKVNCSNLAGKAWMPGPSPGMTAFK